jgi:putative spermidine/putrescine transport system permease protein
MFLFLPAGEVLVGAFKGADGGWTTSNLQQLVHQPYSGAYRTSIEVSLVTALGGAIGLAIAYAAIREGTPRWIRSILTTFSGVAANFGGIPLAFAWIATIGTLGIVTQFLKNQLHLDIYAQGFTLFSKTGVEVVYLYFQIPLMVLVIAPAIDGLRREWREAAANLGASSWQFWRHVGLPVLMPSILGSVILLFGNSFAAYATAYALTSGTVNLVPIVIGSYYTGNVLNNPHLGQALALGMFVVLVVMMVIYIPLQRRAARWVR